MHELLGERASEFGLPFSPPRVLANSRLAILAAEHARTVGLHEPLSRGLFSAYFAQGLNIGDIDVLTEVADGVGLDPESLRSALLDGAYADRIADAAAQARRLGITGVPTFFVMSAPGGERSLPTPRRIVGAQPIEVFRRELDAF